MKQEQSPPEPASAAPTPSTDQIGEDTQHCRRVLLNLIDMGNELAAMFAELALTHQHNPAEARQSATAFNAVARSVRRTVMLHDKLGKPTKAPANRTAARKRIIRAVEDAIQSKAEPNEQETLHAEFLERLDRPDLEDDLAERPIAEIITNICRDLGLGIARLPDDHPGKRRLPHDIAILNARAAQLPNAAPSAELASLLASAPPPPPKRRASRMLTDEEAVVFRKKLSRMTDEELEQHINNSG